MQFPSLVGPLSHILVLSDALSHPPETICHQDACSDQVDGRSEAASGEVALVLYGAIAAGRRHILRHDGRSLSWLNGCSKCAVDAET